MMIPVVPSSAFTSIPREKHSMQAPRYTSCAHITSPLDLGRNVFFTDTVIVGLAMFLRTVLACTPGQHI
jgi:hypothetical protein